MMNKEAQCLGVYKWGGDGQTFSPDRDSYPKTRIYKVENTYVIDRTLMLDGVEVHCRIAYSHNLGRFESMEVYQGEIHVYSNTLVVPINKIFLPQTKQDLAAFVDSGGFILVGKNPQAKTVDSESEKAKSSRNGSRPVVDNKNALQFVRFDKDLNEIFPYWDRVKGGKALIVNPGVFYKNYISDLEEQKTNDCAIAVINYRAEVEKFDQDKYTEDGFNVKELLESIDNYLVYEISEYDLDTLVELEKTFNTLTEIIKLSKNPANIPRIQQKILDIQYQYQVSKDKRVDKLYAGLLIVAGVLTGLAVITCMVLTAGAGWPCLGMLMIAAGCFYEAGRHLQPMRRGNQYNNDVNRVTDFFAKPSTLDQKTKVNDSQLVRYFSKTW